MGGKIHDILGTVAKSEIASWRAECLGPQNPHILAERVKAFREVAGDHVVDSPRTQFWRDAWIASMFSLHRNASFVEMLEPVKTASGSAAPDFQIEINGVWLRYESVEAMPSGRRRSDEFRMDRKFGPRVRDDHVPDRDELTSILSVAGSKKASRSSRYAECCGLVILLNTWALMDDEDRRQAFVEGTRSAAKAFDEVWIIHPPKAQQIWSAGLTVFK